MPNNVCKKTFSNAPKSSKSTAPLKPTSTPYSHYKTAQGPLKTECETDNGADDCTIPEARRARPADRKPWWRPYLLRSEKSRRLGNSLWFSTRWRFWGWPPCLVAKRNGSTPVVRRLSHLDVKLSIYIATDRQTDWQTDQLVDRPTGRQTNW